MQRTFFILMTARKEEESGLTEDSKEAISFVKSLLRSREAIISVDSHAKESVELLRKYLKKYQPQMTAEIVDQAIQKAEYKFLYVKPYLIFGDRIYRDGHKNGKSGCKKLYSGNDSEIFWNELTVLVPGDGCDCFIRENFYS